MRELAVHYERMRRAYPTDELCVMFDIDGTILDMRHMVWRALIAYDRTHGTDHFVGLNPEDVDVHENRIPELLRRLRVPAPERERVATWVAGHLWSRECVLAGARPYRGVLGVIRWFQLQPNTRIALNTGRPEHLREATLASLGSVGRAHRVRFDRELLFMNPHGANRRVAEAKVEGLCRAARMGLRVVAVVDNEPANLAAMEAADDTGEILFLHADTIFESQRSPGSRAVSGSSYELSELVEERDLRRRVQLIWHGVNDEANLRQFLGSEVGWAECDVRRDPLGRLVLRHDSYEQTPWSRAEHAFTLGELLAALAPAGRSVALDLKEHGVLLEAAELAAQSGLDASRLAFMGTADALRRQGAMMLRQRFSGATVCVHVDFLAPLVAASAELARTVSRELRAWGCTRASVDWCSPGARQLIDFLEDDGWEVNVYGVPDLHSFLEAALLLPASVTADFNFPDWHYFGRGSGRAGTRYRYQLVAPA